MGDRGRRISNSVLGPLPEPLKNRRKLETGRCRLLSFLLIFNSKWKYIGISNKFKSTVVTLVDEQGDLIVPSSHFPCHHHSLEGLLKWV